MITVVNVIALSAAYLSRVFSFESLHFALFCHWNHGAIFTPESTETIVFSPVAAIICISFGIGIATCTALEAKRRQAGKSTKPSEGFRVSDIAFFRVCRNADSDGVAVLSTLRCPLRCTAAQQLIMSEVLVRKRLYHYQV